MLRVAVARIAELPAAPRDVAPPWFGDAERVRWASLSPAARVEFGASRLLLRRLLQASTGRDAHCWEISAGAGSAPVASPRPDDGVATAASTSRERALAPAVSLSHRLGWVAAATSDAAARPIGVDIECARPPRSDPGERAALMLPASELACWNGLGAAQREPALLRGWVAREAWFKAAPAGGAPWDFRRIGMQSCAPACANVRTWESGSVLLAVCCDDADALAAANCDGLEAAGLERTSFWRVTRAD